MNCRVLISKKYFLGILITLAVFVCAAVAHAYTPPIGIPDPAGSWGGTQNPIDDQPPSPPSTWTSDVPGYYYINYQTGTDSGRTYGNPTAPRQTIPNPIPAGSYVEVHGTYNYAVGGAIKINGAGTSAAWSANSAGPVWVVGVNGDKPTFTGYMTLITGAYLYLYNINVVVPANTVGIQVGSQTAGRPANHIVVRSIDVQGSTNTAGNTALMFAVGSSSDPIDHVIFHNCTAHDTGPTGDADIDANLAGVASYTSYTWFINNLLYNSSGVGIQVNAAAPSAQYVYIGGNTVYNSRQSGIGVKYGTDVIISQNTVHDVQDRCVGSDTSPSKGLAGQYEPDRVWWLFNTIYNVRYGIRLVSVSTGHGMVYAIGNVIYDEKDMGGSCFPPPSGTNSWDYAAMHFVGGVTRYIVNNTISRAMSGIHISYASTNTTYIENNIIKNITNPNGYFLFAENTSNLTARNNDIFNTTNQAFRWGTTNYPTLSAWQSASGNGANSIQSDPLFVNDTGNIFQLQSGSPAKDSGILSDVYATFYSLYGISIQVDKAGVTRAQGLAWDMGAYEFIDTGYIATKKPSAPLNLRFN